ncbi:MAG: PAS domain S-box protein [Spirochaetota bacterium]|nr:PAS domain S-box protein [Spirochaetota bacterium]
MRYLILTLISVCLVLLSGLSFALEPVILSDDKGEYPLGKHLEYLEDKSGKRGIKDVSSKELSKLFVKSNVDILNFGFTPSAYWIRFKIQIPENSRDDFMLVYEKPITDYLHVYTEQENGQYKLTRKTGSNLPFSTRDIPHRKFVFHLSNQDFISAKYIYIRVKTRASMGVSLRVFKKLAFYQKDHNEQIILGIYYGVIFIIVVYNLFLFLILKDINYINFVYNLIFFGFFLNACINGLTLEYLWPSSPWWSERSLPFFISLSIFFGLNFARNFLNLKSHSPRLNQFTYVISAVLILAMILSLLSVFYKLIQVLNLLSGTYAIFMVCTSLYILKKGYRPAKYLAIAYLAVLVSVLIFILRNQNVIPHIFVTNYSMQIGVLLEVIFFSFALADRINILRDEKEAAQAEALKLKDDFVKTLKEKVNERSLELEQNEERYKVLVERSPYAIILYRDGAVVFLNQSALKLLRSEHADQVLGSAISKICGEDFESEVLEVLQNQSEHDDQVSFMEEKITRLDGDVIEVEIAVMPLMFKGQESILAMIKDITERKRVERLREDTERIVKHDLMNPINGIMGYSELLKQDKLLSESKVHQIATYIYNSGSQMLHLVNNSLNIFKMEEGTYQLTLEECDIIRLLSEVDKELMPLWKGKSIRMVYQLNDREMDMAESYFLYIEKYHIKNVLGNLLKNAIEASPEGENVRVHIGKIHGDFHEIQIHNKSAIPESIIGTFFDRYTTSGKSNGTGIGTYSARLIARAHGGDIRFTTSEETGTTLYVTLPAKTQSKTQNTK